MPRKLKTPTMSVTVVRMIEDDWAGSWRIAESSIGIAAPASPAIVIEIIIESRITSARPVDRLQP